MYSVSSNDADGPVLQDIFPVGMDKKFDDAIRSAYAEPASWFAINFLALGLLNVCAASSFSAA